MMSTPGHHWCVIILHSWQEVMLSRWLTQLPFCRKLRMSGILGMKEGTEKPPRDWAQLSTAPPRAILFPTFAHRKAQSQLMSISQGQRAVREYASQFETLLGRLDSYDEGLMLNQFIWGLQPELARSVSLHYPKSIAQAVLLAETMELAVKASRRLGWKSKYNRRQSDKGPRTITSGLRSRWIQRKRWKYSRWERKPMVSRQRQRKECWRKNGTEIWRKKQCIS